MITINLTIVVEAILFLGFLGLTYRSIWQPLLNLIYTRRQKVSGDRDTSDLNQSAAQRLSEEYRARLAQTDQRAMKQVYDTTYKAHRDRRNLIAELKIQADMEVAGHRDFIQKQVKEQRKHFSEYLPVLIEEMDHQVKTGGSLL